MIKKFGIGTLSPLLVLLAVLWSCNIPYLGDKCFGDLILNTLRFLHGQTAAPEFIIQCTTAFFCSSLPLLSV